MTSQPFSTKSRMMWCAMATGGGVVKPSWCLALEHRRQFLAVEPARVLKLVAIDDDLVRQRLRVTADHQR